MQHKDLLTSGICSKICTVFYVATLKGVLGDFVLSVFYYRVEPLSKNTPEMRTPLQ